MKRFALPALLVAIAFFGISSTASAHPGHGGGPGHSHGSRFGSYYGPSFGGGSCRSGRFGYSPRHRGRFTPPRRSHFRHHYYNRGFRSGGLRIRTGNFGFGIRF